MMTDASPLNEIVSTSALQNVDLSQLTLIDFFGPTATEETLWVISDAIASAGKGQSDIGK